MAPPPPDVRQIELDNLEKRDFPGGGAPAMFRVRLAEAAHADIVKHGLEHRQIEICGVLVGRVLKDANGPYLDIEATVRGEHAASQGAQVTFTHETWNHIHTEMDKRFPRSKIVGWYHTHPSFGIFLSEFDRFIHQSFFNAPFQVAYVFDPSDGDEGFFYWRDGKPARLDHYWVAGAMQCSRPEFAEVGAPAPAVSESGKARTAAESPPPVAAPSRTAPGPATGEREDADRLSLSWLGSMLPVLVLLLAGLTGGYLIGTLQGRRESDAVVAAALQREVREMVRMEILHTGLSRELESLEHVVDSAMGDVTRPGGTPPPTTLPADSVKKSFTEVKERLILLRQRYETLDRLATDAFRQGAKSLEELDTEIRNLRGQMLDLRRIVATELLAATRKMLDDARRAEPRTADLLRQGAEEGYRRALTLTPEDRTAIERLFPEFNPKSSADGPTPSPEGGPR